MSADVIVVGDGPAGSALAAALHRRDVDVALVGRGMAWTATYTTWVDDLDEVAVLDGADVWLHRFDQIAVRFERLHVIDRPYGVIDNDALRTHLQRGVKRVIGVVGSPGDLTARLVIDATGWPPKFAEPIDDQLDVPGWQTAFGVVLAHAPNGLLGTPTMMDYSDPGATILGHESVPSFAYSLPVADGWLVEETVLTASPPIEPHALRPVLAARLGMTVDELLGVAVSTETVRIPMGVSPPHAGHGGPVRFGAAAGMIHPTTGYSIGSALRSADRVATSIELELGRRGEGAPFDAGPVRRAVWPRAARRTRHLHDFGHDVLLRLDRDGVNQFFETFFQLCPAAWVDYLRIDTPPRRLAGVMARMFASSPWRLRARLMTGDPRRFIRMLRP